MGLSANWSYPTTIKFGAGRISGLVEHCKALGIARPLLVTDRAMAALPITAQALDIFWDRNARVLSMWTHAKSPSATFIQAAAWEALSQMQHRARPIAASRDDHCAAMQLL
jgi:alcohol dehydrogenase class IV